MTNTISTPSTPITPIIPRPRPAEAPTAGVCGACNGEGGSWVTNDGSTPGKNIARWEPCRPCGGKGTV